LESLTRVFGIFRNALEFNQPLNDYWDVSDVTNMGSMFEGAEAFNQPLNGWDVSSATDMPRMFEGAETFNQDISNWDISNVTNMIDMLSGSGISVTNYSNILVGWSEQTVQPNVNLGAGDIQYNSEGAAARAILTNEPNNWVITDGGEENGGGGDDGGAPDNYPTVPSTNILSDSNLTGSFEYFTNSRTLYAHYPTS